MGVKEKIRKWSLVTILVERGGEAGWENCGRESREIIMKRGAWGKEKIERMKGERREEARKVEKGRRKR